VPFDPGTGEVTGSPVNVIERVTRAIAERPASDTAQYSISDGGTLVYVDVPRARAPRAARGLAWVKRDGTREPIAVEPDDFTFARVSPDGAHVALVVGDFNEGTAPDIWILNVQTQNLRRLTFEGFADAPFWAPDSSRLYFRGRDAIYTVATEGGTPERIAEVPAGVTILFPSGLSPDGQTILLTNFTTLPNLKIATLSLKDQRFTDLFDDEGLQLNPSMARNGDWIVYQQGGFQEQERRINLRPFPDVGRGLYPAGAGGDPVFSRDGTEIFYFDGGGIGVVPVEYEPSLVVRPAQTLFRGTYWYGVGGSNGARGRAWDPHPDGDRFLMILMPSESNAAARLHVVENWTEELQRLAPVR
jgi:hypothetical protein